MTARYTFPNAWEFARRRLELLEACHDPGSFRRAAALGVGPGWRCLDAGAGGGSFARWPAERTGDVLAVDVDVRLVEKIDAAGRSSTTPRCGPRADEVRRLGVAAVSRYGTRSTACIARRLQAAASVSPCSWRAGFMPAASASRL
jgi:hypothetical protein